MPKFWQSIERSSRIARALAVLGSPDVKFARPEGFTFEEGCALLLSNNVCASLSQSRQFMKELIFSNKLGNSGYGYFVRDTEQSQFDPAEAVAFLDSVAQAKSTEAPDKASVTFEAEDQ